ncbi:uncharacterized protein LOC142302268 [Anomaloglossus baeobatrachus]|uniref:uncharacterized protein LOC142302268 n=1 Tax=Anomaloglossus baeobatrachus TaxID=238106 RepID=UPI003F4F7BAE
MASADLRDELDCSICLSTYTDPVTLSCGHNFCRVCIDQFLNTQDMSRVYWCPQCKAKFHKRPTLIKNIALCNVAEHFRSTQPHQEEITGIHCTYCIHSPEPAVRSCLHCEASLCDNHLRVHSKGPEHVLTDTKTSLESWKCSVHKKILEYYCTEDAACICVSCSLAGEHRGHKVELLDEASEKKKKKLRNYLQKLSINKEATEERVRHLHEHCTKAQEKASGDVERVTALFIDIRRRVDDLEKKAMSEISRQENMILSLFDVINMLEIKKDELSRKMKYIEELCNMTDPLTVLLEPDTGDLCDPEEDKLDEDTGGHKTHDVDVEVITGILHAGFSDIMTYLQTISPEKPKKMSSQPTSPQSIPTLTQHLPLPGVKHGDDDILIGTRGARGKVTAVEIGEIYGQGPVEILPDVNATSKILLSDDRKTASRMQIKGNYPEKAEIFQKYLVISRRTFTSGRHYRDVAIGGSDLWLVGMCYPSIDKMGHQSQIGYNKKSWCLYGGPGYNNQCLVTHNSKVIPIPHQISSDGVRICLDFEAGQMSFYDLCDPIRHLHTFTAAFTEPLHAAFSVVRGGENTSGGASGEVPESGDVRHELDCSFSLNLNPDPPHQDITVPAVRSCLLCEASLCDNHLRIQSKVAEHVQMEPSTSLEKRKCPVHKELFKYYCTEDSKCICLSCKLGREHRGHRLEELDEASEKKKNKLNNVLLKLTTKRKETEKRVQSLEERKSKAQEKTSGEVKRVNALFTDFRRRVDDLEKRVLSEISRREEQVSLSDVIQKLEIKKDELSKKMRHIEELCNMRDPLAVLQDPVTGDLYYLKTENWVHVKQNNSEIAEIFQKHKEISHRTFPSGRHFRDVEIVTSTTFSFLCFSVISLMASADLKDELLCSICMNIYTDPVTLRCGHNFCRECIDGVLDTEGGYGDYSCPECRATFRKWPPLQRNIALCNVVETVLATHPHQEKITGIRCTYCIHSPVPAVKSCLLCEVSLCDNHLKVHKRTATDHVLTEPSTSLQNRKCSMHRKILEYYCTEDSTCICVSCSLAIEHQGHWVEMLDEASEKKKKKLRNVRQRLITKREKTEKRVQSLEKRWRNAQEKAAGEVKRVTALFTEIRSQVDVLEKKILSEIVSQKEELSLSLSDVIQKLEIKKDELSRKMRHIEELCNMTDPLTVLQELDTGDLCDPEEEGDEDTEGHDGGDEDTGGHDGGDEDTGGHDGGDEDTGGHDGGDEDTEGHDGGDEDTGGHDGGDEDTGGHDGGDEDTEGHDGGDEDTGGHDKTHDVDVDVITRMLHAGFSDIMTFLKTISPTKPEAMRPQPSSASSLPNLTKHLQLLDIKHGGDDVSVRTVERVTVAGPEDMYGQDPADILLDVNTAGNNLLISDDLKTVNWTNITQNRPEGFLCNKVMSSRSFTSGRHYWDVEISRTGLWMMGMCYPSIDHRGRQSFIGNNMSWGLCGGLVYNNQCSVKNNRKRIWLPQQISSDGVRIYLDYEAGQLSFYELCDPIRHLHTITAAFTEPLHASLYVYDGSIKILGRSICEEPS